MNAFVFIRAQVGGVRRRFELFARRRPVILVANPSWLLRNCFNYYFCHRVFWLFGGTFLHLFLGQSYSFHWHRFHGGSFHEFTHKADIFARCMGRQASKHLTLVGKYLLQALHWWGWDFLIQVTLISLIRRVRTIIRLFTLAFILLDIQKYRWSSFLSSAQFATLVRARSFLSILFPPKYVYFLLNLLIAPWLGHPV